MSASFVPLIPGAMRSERSTIEARVRRVPREKTGEVFQPVASQPQVTEAICEGLQSTVCEETGTRPKVTLIREGTVVKRIRIECGCGQVTELECAY